MGLYSSALLECEGILQLQPNSPDIVALMGEIESRTAPSSRNGSNGSLSNGSEFGLISDDHRGSASLIALPAAAQQGVQRSNGKGPVSTPAATCRWTSTATTATSISPSS